jgi:uncharacterized protein YmfQ (DUF2313 family)
MIMLRLSPKDYLTRLQDLLPTGAIWTREPGAWLTRLLLAIAGPFSRARDTAIDLASEVIDPRQATLVLGDWEGELSLPDPCSAGIATTLQERRAAVVARLTATGGASPAYFEGLASALGYAATITEFRPFVAGRNRCGDTLNGGHAVRHVWRVTVHGPRVTRFRAGASQCGDRLAKITRAEDLECVLRRLKPAHTTLVVAYEEAGPTTLVTDTGATLITDTGDAIAVTIA